jgi:hypothetical protein
MTMQVMIAKAPDGAWWWRLPGRDAWLFSWRENILGEWSEERAIEAAKRAGGVPTVQEWEQFNGQS